MISTCKTLKAVVLKNTTLWDMELCSLVESYEDFEEDNYSHTKVRILKVQQNVPHIYW